MAMTPEQRKSQILEAAKKLFSKKGYYKTQIADIVESTNIARGTIYNYFKNKDDIFITLLEDYCRSWQQSLDRDRVDLTTITPRDFLKTRISRTLNFFAGDPYLTNIILRVGIGLPGGAEISIRRFEETILNVISNYLRLGIRAGSIKEDLNIEITSNLLCGAILHIAYCYFGPDNKKRDPADISRLSEEITDVISNGIFI